MGYKELVERWGVDIERPLLRQALTHRSFAYEHNEPHNERLEFLGDSILGFVVAEKLYRTYPDASEGDMSRMKTFAVSERGLAEVARRLELGGHIRLGKGEKKTGGANKDSILSDTVEALIGATYMQHGIDVARKIVEKWTQKRLDDASVLGPNLDWQTSFEKKIHTFGVEGLLEFEFTSEGPDHERIFYATAFLGETLWGKGKG
ncbi:MAG: ribonuclease III, partial [Actinomycetaceae bacterium]|nr:ribonuclease III [Actinomycetaceae bacterium]